jgi:hypothetical protein
MPDIHPNIADAYRRKVERLAETLRDPDTKLEAVTALRSIIGRVVLNPRLKWRAALDKTDEYESPLLLR